MLHHMLAAGLRGRPDPLSCTAPALAMAAEMLILAVGWFLRAFVVVAGCVLRDLAGLRRLLNFVVQMYPWVYLAYGRV